MVPSFDTAGVLSWVSGSVALMTWSSLPTFAIVVFTAEDWSLTLPFVAWNTIWPL